MFPVELLNQTLEQENREATGNSTSRVRYSSRAVNKDKGVVTCRKLFVRGVLWFLADNGGVYHCSLPDWSLCSWQWFADPQKIWLWSDIRFRSL